MHCLLSTKKETLFSKSIFYHSSSRHEQEFFIEGYDYFSLKGQCLEWSIIICIRLISYFFSEEILMSNIMQSNVIK
jgi:hypothetical protein